METLNRDTTRLLKEIKSYSSDFGTDCMDHLNLLMYYFSGSNNDIKSLINFKMKYDEETEPTAKEKYLTDLFENLDKLFFYNEETLQELRYSVIQVNKLLTEIEIYKAKTHNLVKEN